MSGHNGPFRARLPHEGLSVWVVGLRLLVLLTIVIVAVCFWK